MQLRLATIADKEQWDAFVRTQPAGTFMQTWAWGDFMIAQHRPVWRYVVEDAKKQIVGAMLVYKGMLKGKGNFLYAPRGPVVQKWQPKAVELLVNALNDLAKTEKSWYVQCDPLSEDETVAVQFVNHGFRRSKDSVQPRYTLIMDIGAEPEALLAAMHPKTRYNIKLAQRKGVQIVVDNTNVDDFVRLLHNTEERQRVRFYGKEYFQTLLASPLTALYCAKYKGEIIAANIMVFDGTTATYLFGGTDNRFRSVMAPHLLQWQAMLDAKEKGCTTYDFWGAAPADATGKEASWIGITRFKQGFTPTTPLTTYIGSFEKVYRPNTVMAYRMLQKLVR